MNQPPTFADLLNQYVERTAYTPGQLATLSHLPKSTIVNWLRGRVDRPRDWQPLLQLLAVLRVDEQEADRLLQAAGQAPLSQLRRLAEKADQELLAPWPPAPVSLRAAQAAPVRPAPPFQAVPVPPYFVGRDAELAQLEEWLRAGERCLLHGLPGVGKTALAAHLAHRLRPELADGVLWASPANSSPMPILGTIAQAYGVDVSQLPDVDSRSRVVRDLLAKRQTLLVLDDVQDSEQVEPLLPPGGRCAVLITSRYPNLRVAVGARRLALRPFPATGQEPHQLFARLLGEERARGDAAALEEIARLLGYLPLALLLVASRLAYEPGWQTSELLAALQRPAGRLQTVRYEQDSLQHSFALALEPLSPAERRLFACLSLFGGPTFSAEAVAAATGCSLETAREDLRRLYALSLVQVAEEGRFGLHPVVHDLAQVNFDQAPAATTAAAHTRLLAHYRQLLERQSPLTPTAVGLLAVEQENIRGALQLAHEEGYLDQFAATVLDFIPYLRHRGLLAEAGQLLEQVASNSEGQQAVHCALLQAQVARQRRDYEQAESHLQQAAVQPQLNPAAEGWLLAEKGSIAACRHDYVNSRALLEQALPLLRQSQGAGRLVAALKELGATLVALAEYDNAERAYREALALARQAAPVQVPILLRALGGLAVSRDRDYRQAAVFYEEALEEAGAFVTHPARPALLNNLAVARFQSRGGGQEVVQDTEEQLRAALALARQSGEGPAAGLALVNLGRLARFQNDEEQADRYFQEALILAQTINYPVLENMVRGRAETITAPPQLLVIFD